MFKAPEQNLPGDGMASTTKPPDKPKTAPEPTPKKHKPELMIECLIDSLTANKEKASKLQIVKLSENAITPTRGSAKAAGYDLYSAREVEIPARGKSLVETDIQVKVPEGTYGRIAPRSGLAWRNHVDIGAGVVDEDYRGNVGEYGVYTMTAISSSNIVRCGNVQPRGHRVCGQEGRQDRSIGL